MKAHAEQTFRADLTDLSKEEALTILEAVSLLAGMDPAFADEDGISLERISSAQKIFSTLAAEFSESK